MKKRTLAVLSAAVMAAAVMAGCSSNKAEETTAVPVTTAEAATEAAAEVPKTESEDTADLIVAGGDGAGVIAAIQAVKEGADPAKVIIVEKSGALLSDIAGMEDFINAANTDEQYDQEIEDSFEAFLADIKKAGNDKNNEELAEFIAESGEAALTWLRDLGIDMEGVEKQDGSSVARSFSAAGDVKLTKALTDALLKEAETLKIQVLKDTTVKEIMMNEEGWVSGIKVAGKDGERTISTKALFVTDSTLLPLLKTAPVLFTTDADKKETGVLVNNCAEVLDINNEAIQGLYAAGSLIETAVHGEKALPGNRITSMILFGTTAGTEAGIFISDNQ